MELFYIGFQTEDELCFLRESAEESRRQLVAAELKARQNEERAQSESQRGQEKVISSERDKLVSV